MDDPWGSPWSSADVPNATKPLDLEPPPRARLSPNLPSSSNLSPQSPWVDDDAFGDWASGDTATSPGGSNPWASWTAEPSSTLQPRPRRESQRKDSTSAWSPSNPSSPSLRPLPHAHTPTPTLSRQPSFDPWKSDISLKITIDEPPSEDTDKPVSAFSTNSIVNDPPDSLPTASSVLAPDDQVWRPVEDSEAQETADAPSAAELESVGVPIQDVASDVDPHASRPSSRSSGDSKHQEFNGESPVTSIEEETRRRPPQRKVSSKVQELVHMYDDLAKKPDPPELVPAKPRSIQSGILDDAGQIQQVDEDATFGDAGSEDQDQEADFSAPLQLPSIPGKDSGSLQHEGDVQTGNVEISPQASPAKPNAWQVPSTVFEIPSTELKSLLCTDTGLDPQSVDELINTPEESPNHHRRSDSLERAVYDNFETVEERKYYFRSLRFGTLLRNNAVDYDNYVSPPWSKVLLHDETLAKLHDWKEGGSAGISGFGSNNYRSSGFGWDSSAPTVSMDDIFGRRSTKHSRKSSGHVRKASRGSDKHGSGPRSPISPNRANFGWGFVGTEAPASMNSNKTASILPPESFGSLSMPPKSGLLQTPNDSVEKKPAEQALPKSTVRTVQSDGFHPNPPAANTFSKPPSSNLSNGKIVPGPWTPLAPAQIETKTKTSPSSSIIIDTGFDNDDEWGEMITSPSTDTPAPLKDTPTAGSVLPGFSTQHTNSPDTWGVLGLNTTTPALDQISSSKAPDFSLPNAGTAPVEPITSADQQAIDKVIKALPNLSWMLQ